MTITVILPDQTRVPWVSPRLPKLGEATRRHPWGGGIIGYVIVPPDPMAISLPMSKAEIKI